jgi:molybdopterin converting factor small subunit
MSGNELKPAPTEPVEVGAVHPALTIEYFALFRSLAKKSEESLEFPDAEALASIPALYDSLRARYGFPLERASVHVAVNDAYVAWDRRLEPGDRVVFIPPVAGG